TATADTTSCSHTLPAHTNGNLPNDLPQQLNKNAGDATDLTACTIRGLDNGLNGADNNTGTEPIPLRG
ncbi:hypothetical protein LUZ16_29145, partial [Streptomyces albireticuli]